MSLIKWIIFNGLFLCVGLWATINPSAENVFIFFAAGSGLLNILAFGTVLFSLDLRKSVQSRPLPVPMWVDGLYDMVMIALMAYTGHFVIASVYALGVICLQLAYALPPTPPTPLPNNQ